LRGHLAARWDIRHGRYKVLTYGLPDRGYSEYARHLQQSYGIDLRPAAFCTASQPLMAYVDNYDEVSIPAAKRKFGHDVFKETRSKVEEEIGSGLKSE